MSIWSPYKFTDAGKILQLKAEAGTELKFTKAVFGSGVAASTDEYENRTALIEPVLEAPISHIDVDEVSKFCKVTVLFNNDSLTSPTFIREAGLYAQDPDGGDDILFVVAIDSAPDCLPAGGAFVHLEKCFEINIVITEAANVTAVIDPAGMVTMDYFKKSFNHLLEEFDERLNEAEENFAGQIENSGNASAAAIDISIAAADWVLNDEADTSSVEGYKYRADVLIEKVTENMAPMFSLTPAMKMAVVQAGLMDYRTAAGKVSFYAADRPTGTIAGKLYLLSAGGVITDNGGNVLNMPAATTSSIGGIIIGDNLTIDENHRVSVDIDKLTENMAATDEEYGAMMADVFPPKN